MRAAWVRDGAILLAIGLSFTALGAAAMGVFDACIANATCSARAGTLDVEGFLGLLCLGVVLAVAGATFVATGLRLAPRNAVDPDGFAGQDLKPSRRVPRCRGMDYRISAWISGTIPEWTD